MGYEMVSREMKRKYEKMVWGLEKKIADPKYPVDVDIEEFERFLLEVADR